MLVAAEPISTSALNVAALKRVPKRSDSPLAESWIARLRPCRQRVRSRGGVPPKRESIAAKSRHRRERQRVRGPPAAREFQPVASAVISTSASWMRSLSTVITPAPVSGSPRKRLPSAILSFRCCLTKLA